MREYFIQLILFLLGLSVELGAPLFLTHQGQKRVVRLLGILLIGSALIWAGYELGQKDLPSTANSVDQLTPVSAPTDSHQSLPTGTATATQTAYWQVDWSEVCYSDPIALGETRNGTTMLEDVDCYGFSISRESLIRVSVVPMRALPHTLTIWDTDDSIVIDISQNDGMTAVWGTESLFAAVPGKLYVAEVKGDTDRAGSYQITVTEVE